MIRALFTLLFTLSLCIYAPAQTDNQDLIISSVNFTGLTKKDTRMENKYRALMLIKAGDRFDFSKIRKSISVLYKTGDFADIEVKKGAPSKGRIALYFQLMKKYRVKSIKIKSPRKLSRKKIRKSIFSLTNGGWFDSDSLKKAENEIKEYLRSSGYFSHKLRTEIRTHHEEELVGIRFIITPGRKTKLEKISVVTGNSEIKKRLEKDLKLKYYSPLAINKIVEKIKNILKKQKYFFPTVNVKEVFSNAAHSSVKVTINVTQGYKYIFRFIGIGSKKGLIESIWQKDVYEKWAERESKARISLDLKSRGYLKAEVDSSIEVKDNTKIITFTIDKHKKYSLGKINIEGNKSFSDKELLKYFATKDNIFDKLFWLRPISIQNDLNLLRLFYYDRGYPRSVIKMSPSYRKKKADINITVREGEKYSIESILFDRNKHFKSHQLLPLITSKVNGPFSQLRINKDTSELRKFYISQGFKDVTIDRSISPGTKKSVMFTVNEGQPFKMGKLIIMGASGSQESMLRSLFPFPEGAPCDTDRIDEYRDEISKQSLFTEFRILYIEKDRDTLDILINVKQDKSVFYGAGIGYEERRHFRGTFEYQRRNVLGSTSTFSAIAQVGFNEQRGALTMDTPFFMNTRFLSSARIWKEYEIYPSYKFERIGLGETLTYQIDPNTFTAASLRWYSTKLTELKVEEAGLDFLNKPFSTLAMTLAYTSDNRDDPFNASSGDFFSTNLKVGVPFPGTDTKFIKFSWNYQQNIRLFRNGVFSYSLRNGFAWGDLSITERFFAGGFRTFRGVKNDLLGPISANTNNPVGGKSMLLINLEATFPIHFIPIEDLYYTVFTDFGNVFKDPLQFKLQDLKWCAGLSLKYKTPIGPVRLDFAWNLKEVPGNNFVIQIGIGNVF